MLRSWQISTSLELVKDGQKIARLVVEKGLDDLLTPDFAENIDNAANGMRQRNGAFLWLI
jgi:hypothetical protein